MSYCATGSGLLTGGGLRRFKARRHVMRGGNLRHFPDVHMSDSGQLKRVVPLFDSALEFEYTGRELLLLAEKILLEDEKPPYENPVWLTAHALNARAKREIYVSSGTPDPSKGSGLYWRTHPNGRKFKTVAERQRHGDSFYR